jgi:hypothetical protein
MRHKLFKIVIATLLIYTTLDLHRLPPLFAAKPTKTRPASRIKFKMPKLPPKSPPGNRSGNASRGCEPPNVVLVPEIQGPISEGSATTITQVWGNTASERPTFWVATGGASQTNSSVEFVLQTEDGSDLYRTTLPTTDTATVLPIALPSTVSLVVETRYHWFITSRATMMCPTPAGLRQKKSNAYSEGWVERVAINPMLASKLKGASSMEQAALYADAGLWFEAITVLGELRSREPKTAQSDWEALLESVGLQEQGQIPIAQTQSPEIAK